MTISEIQVQKEEIEKQIERLLSNFEKERNVSLNVEVESHEMMGKTLRYVKLSIIL